MKSLRYWCWLPSLLLAMASILSGVRLALAEEFFYAREDISTWVVQSSRLACTLKHPVPAYGEAIFFRESGERLLFSLFSERPLPRADQVVLESLAPPWADQDRLHLGLADGHVGSTPLMARGHLASKVLSELMSGRFPLVSHEGWVIESPVRVKVSAVNFGSAYDQYIACVQELYPANFRQLERTSVLFDTDKSDIKAEFLDRIDLVVGYLSIDPTVNKVFVDGHTDSVGGNGYNWDLSKRRAEAVVLYLKSQGLSDDQVIMRYHGELLPITDNNSALKRARNRRVTLRLEKTAEL